MNNVLKPCPFCGGEAITEGRKIIGNYKSDRKLPNFDKKIFKEITLIDV